MSHLRSLKYVIVFQLMVIAIVISLLFLFCMREQIVEQWWIFRLHTGNTRTQLVATSVLSAKHSVRCVPVLLQQIKIHLQHVPLSPCSHSNYIFDPAGGDRSPYTDK